jgi:ABC-type sugar transport system ATPase subunit
VSHRFAEVNRLCEEVTVLRDGRTVDVLAGERLSVDALVEAVVVDERPETSTAERAVGTVAPPVVLEADAVVGRRLRGVSVAVRAGEILGVCGLNGSGVDELLDILGGSIRARSGTVRVRGSDVTWRSPADAHRHGVAFMPAERSRAGMLELPIRQNLRLGGGSGVARMFTTAGHERARAVSALEPFGLAHRADEPLRALSGGNRQKVLMARCLEIADVALVINNPTVGVDLKARADIHDLVRRGAGEGRAVVLTSSEPEELIALADRVLVITRGAVSSELSGDNMTLAALVRSLTVEAVGA